MEGLTYRNMYSQMETQYLQNDYKRFYFHYDNDDKQFRPRCNHHFIEMFREITPVMYELWCGS
ncbi:hypothetical protein PGAG_00050 [Phaeocystis globosa virus 12T]|uniref:Uncharacterized protein n=1 Tax=Phaeocystis globosa virus PgV-16T TaxID=3071227 RepID=A0AC59EWS1_9VIRU|nr:hypothetical protein PGCG_00090 [Phaeocystis globosa virus]AET72940.1 hypothetical protein PGAG_00050 [Phaeocystis globosa virus 12T]AET73758.1 hypothetical protein PGBG_00050 [Phaeocystis globosa virus 14T]AGM15402.1 hypothetical protein PGCG_00090 [Phaeocystis globosa virus PgV-16T]UYE94132.1 hypothetical protein PGV14T_00090 [Phaeocystis globosa virus]